MAGTMIGHSEMARDYFERQGRRGRRVIFQWSPETRWPGAAVNENLPAVYFEGAEFESAQAAERFDLGGSAEERRERLTHVMDNLKALMASGPDAPLPELMPISDMGPSWERFDSWAAAEAWLNDVAGVV